LAVADTEPEVAPSLDAVSLAEYPSDEEQYRFCTEALVRGPALPSQDEVRQQLRGLGDSLIVIRAGEVLKLHVHSDDPEAVFAYLRGVGTLVTHKAEDMRAQHAAVERAARGHVQLARRPVSIVTDSACDLSEEILRAHGIHIARMSLVEGDRVFRDGVDITAVEFHERLRRGGALPTTSQPAPGEFIDAYARALEEGESVVAVLVSSALSGTFRAGEAAAARVEGGSVHMVDSLGVSLLQGLMVLKASELAELGHPPAAIADELRRIRAKSGLLLTIATFERLLASGRVGRGTALAGRLLSVKPILGLNHEGVVVRFGRALGAKRARAQMLRLVREHIPPDVRRVRFGVAHVGLPEIVEQVSTALRAEYGRDVEILSAPVTSVVATHVGTGAWALAYLVED
jgi:DegV family protein with EDD domain